jgi:hypothetical protein
MGLNRDVNSLTPKTREMALEFMEKTLDAGIFVAISEARRSLETQAVYYLRGRVNTTDPNIVEAIRILGNAHAWKFTPAEVNKTVTWTLDSNHLDGNAIDIVVYDDQHKPDWNYKGDRWKKVLDIAREIGFTCGADWAVNDFPHLENRKE